MAAGTFTFVVKVQIVSRIIWQRASLWHRLFQSGLLQLKPQGGPMKIKIDWPVPEMPPAPAWPQELPPPGR